MNSLFDVIKKPKFKLFFFRKMALWVILTYFNSNSAYSQDIHYSQFFNNQVYANPAFSGLNYNPRIALFYRNQYPGISNGFGAGFTTYSLAYDQHLPSINSGIGALLFYDTKANGILNSLIFQASYAYQVRIKKKLGLKLGINIGLNSTNLDWSKLQYYDQIDPINGFFNNIPTNEPQPSALRQTNFDAGLGFVFFNQAFYAGAALKHITTQKNNLYNNINSDISPLYIGIQAGSIIKLSKKHVFYLSPNVMYGYQYAKHEVLPAVMMNYEMVNIGLGMRHTFEDFESVILYLGMSKGMVRINYSHDLTVSALAGKTGGSHELSFKFILGGEDNSLNARHNNGQIPCPDILRK